MPAAENQAEADPLSDEEREDARRAAWRRHIARTRSTRAAMAPEGAAVIDGATVINSPLYDPPRPHSWAGVHPKPL
jgi:hypothetical protein